MVDDAVSYALQHTKNSPLHDDPSESATVSLAIDRLAVNLGKAIADIVPGYISTEVDPRLSFDTEASIQRGLRIIDMYETLGVPKSRVLIKLAATWEGILAAEQLQARGIQCNLTLVFSLTQAIACAQYGAHLISPFPGRYVSNATRRIYLTHFPKNLTLTTKTMQNPRLVQNERGPDARCRARAGRRCRRLS
jgi:transaldolase